MKTFNVGRHIGKWVKKIMIKYFEYGRKISDSCPFKLLANSIVSKNQDHHCGFLEFDIL